MNKILIIEDEKNVREGLENYLRKEKFEVTTASSFAEGTQTWNEQTELVVLDWRLGDGNGVDLLKEKRSQGMETPVIMLTAKNELVDKVVGLELGANDYMTKPFEPRELLARITVQFRQANRVLAPSIGEDLISQGELEIDKKSYKVRWGGKEKNLTLKEYELLNYFVENPGKVFNREELLNSVWGLNQMIETRTVDIHVVALRKKLQESCIETVRGVGYRWRQL